MTEPKTTATSSTDHKISSSAATGFAGCFSAAGAAGSMTILSWGESVARSSNAASGGKGSDSH